MKISFPKRARLIFLITFLAAASTPTFAVDIKEVFLRVKHPLFLESVRPFIHSNYYEPAGKNAPITQADIEQLFENYVKRGILDTQNHYIEFSTKGGMGPYIRQYALYFSSDSWPILIGSDLNAAIHEKYTSNFALCQSPNKQWIDCTDRLLPKVTVFDFLKAEKTLTPKAEQYFWVQLKLPRKGTSIQFELVCDSLTFLNQFSDDYKANEVIYTKEWSKFSKKSMIFKWEKEELKFILP